jgi:hypothetical protein
MPKYWHIFNYMARLNTRMQEVTSPTQTIKPKDCSSLKVLNTTFSDMPGH